MKNTDLSAYESEIFFSAESIAHHEAGHIALALYFNHKFSYAILDGKNSFVRFFKKKVFNKIQTNKPLSAKNKRFLIEDIQVTLAGNLSQGKFLNLPHCCSTGADMDHVSLITNALIENDWEDPTEIEGFYIEKTNEILNSAPVSETVAAIADMLLNRKTLAYQECLEVYRNFKKIN